MGSVTGRPVRRHPYTGSVAASLWRPHLVRSAALACVLLLGGASAGCSYRLGSFFGGDDDKPEHTASIRAGSAIPPAAAAAQPSEHDLAYARAAASDALSRGGKDASLPWENPSTGARGTITPLANSYTQEGIPCRDFLASYVRDGQESWLQGGACRMSKGKWEVRNLKPWKRP